MVACAVPHGPRGHPGDAVFKGEVHKTDKLEMAANLVGINAVVAKVDGVRSLLTAVDSELLPK